MTASPGRRLLRDARGATLVEFGMVLPVMLMVMFGMWEMCYRIYVQSVLTGAIQQAGRRSSLEGVTPASLAAEDQRVIDTVHNVAPSATWTSSRKTYRTFSEIAPEPFTDSNRNNIRDPGECYADVNGNGNWDSDPGKDGQGAAHDVTMYTVTIDYPRLLPVSWMFGGTSTQRLTARTIFKNQPFDTKNETPAPTVCTP